MINVLPMYYLVWYSILYVSHLQHPLSSPPPDPPKEPHAKHCRRILLKLWIPGVQHLHQHWHRCAGRLIWGIMDILCTRYIISVCFISTYVGISETPSCIYKIQISLICHCLVTICFFSIGGISLSALSYTFYMLRYRWTSYSEFCPPSTMYLVLGCSPFWRKLCWSCYTL